MPEQRIGWHFPPTNGGRIDGFNDPGIAHFAGRPLSSLTRETIQNSLDAKQHSERPVDVSFELIEVTADDVQKGQLATAITACMEAPGATDKRVVDALQQALETIKKDKIPCLRVSDRNTTGLQDQQWKALVKMQGASFKDDLEGAGGSFGIGKYAPFAVSLLRTVFYWTCYQEGNAMVEKFQGKSVLMSHQGNDGETQGTGFYGVRHGCRELTTSAIPDCFRIVDSSGKPLCGTGVAIWGFQMLGSWRHRIAASAIENYFFAIRSGNLCLTIEPDEMTASELVSIDKANLKAWFKLLLAEAEDNRNTTDLRQAETLWEMSATPPTAETQDRDLGHCKLWIRVDDGLRKKVAFVRRSGMLVTTEQTGLLRFPGFKDFLALCVFEDPSGNELLRGMENPRHDQFEWQRLPESDRRRGKRALDRITRWIREQIGLQAGPPKGGRETVLTELAAYLPDMEPDEPLDRREEGDEASDERGIGDRVTVGLKPIRRVGSGFGTHEDVDYERSGDDSGGYGGGADDGDGGEGGGDGSGDGDGKAGSGSKGGGRGPRTEIGLSNVRILPVEEGANRYRILFRSDRSCRVRLTFEEAGDSIMVRRTDIVATDPAISLDDWQVVRGQKCEVEVTATGAPMGDRAWRVSAVLAQECME